MTSQAQFKKKTEHKPRKFRTVEICWRSRESKERDKPDSVDNMTQPQTN